MEPGAFGLLVSSGADSESFAAFEAGDDFFAVDDIEILHPVDSGVAPHHRSPASAMKPAERDLWAPFGRE